MTARLEWTRVIGQPRLELRAARRDGEGEDPRICGSSLARWIWSRRSRRSLLPWMARLGGRAQSTVSRRRRRTSSRVRCRYRFVIYLSVAH